MPKSHWTIISSNYCSLSKLLLVASAYPAPLPRQQQQLQHWWQRCSDGRHRAAWRVEHASQIATPDEWEAMLFNRWIYRLFLPTPRLVPLLLLVISPLTPTAAISVQLWSILCQTGLSRSFVIFDIRALWRSVHVKNYKWTGLTRSGTGCCIAALPIWQQWASKG